MTKIEELRIQRENLLKEMGEALNNKDIEKATKCKDDIIALDSSLVLLELQDKGSEPDVDNAHVIDKNTSVHDSANFLRAVIKKASNKKLTEAENALLMPETPGGAGTNGEGYLIKEDIRTRIVKAVRDYGSLRDVVGVIPVSSPSGQIPKEGFESLTGLDNFKDGTDGKDSNEVRFDIIEFTLEQKACFIKLSNTLLELADEDLLNYIVTIFARKLVITENIAIISALKSNKSAKAIKDIDHLSNSITVDLDPAAQNFTVIVTNQDGFGYLSGVKDSSGKPRLQPDSSNPKVKRLDGYEIKVVSNGVLSSSEERAPVFYGDLYDGVKLLTLNAPRIATDTSAGFYSNTTVARIITHVGAVQFDKSDKCYIYGTLPTSIEESAG